MTAPSVPSKSARETASSRADTTLRLAGKKLLMGSLTILEWLVALALVEVP
jgi:hypothetical protein